MSTRILLRQPYEAPAICETKLRLPNDLFTRLSVCAEVDDWVDGGELE